MSKFSRLQIRMTMNFLDILVGLYLARPGIAWFRWNEIYENLPPLNGYDGNNNWRMEKDCYERNFWKIVACAREHEYHAVIDRKGDYYTITNLEDVIASYYRYKNLKPPPFKASATNKAIWPNLR